MPFEPQRFIHAANIRLDVPVSVHFSEQLTDELRHALEDATLTSFDSVVRNCIEHKVDFLLLSGNVFLEADRSLRARLSLLKGFRNLETKQIPVFVLPGDADPAEAWRSIPELPDNVTVCYSSSAEPKVLSRNGRVITTVSVSMWYGETDAFGIRVIGRSEDGQEPYRIGVVSKAKYDESRRMAALSSSTDDDFLNVSIDQPKELSPTDSEIKDPEIQSSEQRTSATAETTADYEAGFRDHINQLMTEGHLNYVAFMGELDRLTLTLESGQLHCPGTTQPRSQLEADGGQCSLVQVTAAGKTTIEEINTSAVDWKNIDLDLDADATVNSSLLHMKSMLLQQPRSKSDRVWAIRWTVRGPLPVLHEFIEEDLELTVAVELEELEVNGRKIRLVHQVRALPDPWEVPEKESLGQQYADLITEDGIVSRRRLMNLVRSDTSLSDGWRQRFAALVAGVDRERILSRMRIEGADWFVSDLQDLLPDFDDFDENILQDEAVETYGLTGDDAEVAVENALALTTQLAFENTEDDVLPEDDEDAANEEDGIE